MRTEKNYEREFHKNENEYYVNNTKVNVLNSPRQIIQRKPQSNNIERRKRLTQKDFKATFCYISPSRELKHQKIDSSEDLLANISSFDNKKNQNTQSSINVNLQNAEALHSSKQQINNKKQKIDTLQDVKSINEQLKAQVSQLKVKNLDYAKQLKIITVEKVKYQRQNLKMLQQLKNKDNQFQKIKQINYNLNQSFQKQTKIRQNRQQTIKNLQQMIVELNKKIDQLINDYHKQSINRHLQEKITHRKNQYCEILQNFEQQLSKLKLNLKYCGIQNQILKKKNNETQNLKKQIQKLKDSNKKLKDKVDQLTRIKHKLINTVTYDPIFQLTPQKD